jgi:hypothetical protein
MEQVDNIADKCTDTDDGKDAAAAAAVAVPNTLTRWQCDGSVLVSDY